MKKATDALLSDHKMIRKLLESFRPDNPRAGEVFKTLARVVLTHAWFEDVIFLPAFEHEPRLAKRYIDELYQEHKDIDYFLTRIGAAGGVQNKESDADIRQFRAILDQHLVKEEAALFPLAEMILDNEGLNRLGAEMERRQTEASHPPAS